MTTIPAEFPDLRRLGRARALRRVFLVLLVAFIGLGLAGVFGVRTRTVSASSGGYDLEVEYVHVTRPGLDSPWSATITHRGGFTGPVTLAATSDYFDMFDENGLDPDSIKVQQDGRYIIWTFEKPPGDTLKVSFDAILSPGQQWGHGGVARVLENGRPAVEVKFHTWVSP